LENWEEKEKCLPLDLGNDLLKKQEMIEGEMNKTKNLNKCEDLNKGFGCRSLCSNSDTLVMFKHPTITHPSTQIQLCADQQDVSQFRNQSPPQACLSN
jgi:hypothetical protein